MIFQHKSGIKHICQAGSTAARRFDASKDYKLVKGAEEREAEPQPLAEAQKAKSK